MTTYSRIQNGIVVETGLSREDIVARYPLRDFPREEQGFSRVIEHHGFIEEESDPNVEIPVVEPTPVPELTSEEPSPTPVDETPKVDPLFSIEPAKIEE